MYCEYCGTELKEGQLFCPKCGSKIEIKKEPKKKTNKGKTIIALICCIVLLITGTVGGLYLKNKNEAVNAFSENYIALEAGFTDVKITDEESALKAIESVADVIGIQNAQEELLIDRTDSIEGINYYRFNQRCNAVSVDGKYTVIVADKEGNALALTSNYTNTESHSIHMNDNLTQEIVNENISNTIGQSVENVDELDNQKIVYIKDADEFVYAYKLFASTKTDTYLVYINAENGTVMQYSKLFDCTSSEVVSESGQSKATGWKNDDGSYHLYNDEHKISIFDFSQLSASDHSHWSLKELGIDTMYSKTNVFDEKGIKLMSYLCQFDDYYRSLGDKGFNQIHAAINDKIGTNASADGCTYEDNNKSIRIGALFVGENRSIDDIDIISHEYTHMVSKSINRWEGEEGSALNEGFSDIFGEIIENKIKGSCDWKHDERNIADPENKNNKQRYPASLDYLESAKKHKKDRYYINNSQTEDYSHFASVIISHCAYLMNNGIDGTSDKKISTNKLGKLWYSSLYLMQPNVSFEQCRCAVELAARIMLNNKELTSNQYKCVQEAFDNVGIDRASYTYKKTVKNDFDLKVVNSLETEDVVFDYKIYNVANINLVSKEFSKFFAPFTKNLDDYKIEEKNAVTGNQHITLKDGTYTIVITENSPTKEKEPIVCKIIVDGTNENSTDEVIIKTDFDEVITVEIPNEEYVMSDYLGKSLEEISSKFGSNYTTVKSDSSNITDYVVEGPVSGIFYQKSSLPPIVFGFYTEGALKKSDICKYILFSRKRCADMQITSELSTETKYSDLIKKGVSEAVMDEADYYGLYYASYDTDKYHIEFDYSQQPTKESVADWVSISLISTERNQIETTTDATEQTTESSDPGKFYGNATAEQLRKSIVGSWGALGSIIPEYNFFADGSCSGDMPWTSSGTYSISDDKTLTIKWGGKSDKDEYVWSTESWDDFYSHHKSGTYFWCLRDDDVLMLNGKEKYREGVDYQKFNSSGDLMTVITGSWVFERGKMTEYQINSDGTWVENSVYISGGKVIRRTQLDNGKVEIIDSSTARLWQEVTSLSQLSSYTELKYDSKNDTITIGGSNNTYIRE